MALLERDPMAGEPLLGKLIGFRRVVVSDRHWRIVWRIRHRDSGLIEVEIAEVWAIGARADSEVYSEMEKRVRELGDAPKTKSLQEVVESLGRVGRGLHAAVEPAPAEPLPVWLVRALTTAVGLTQAEVDTLTQDEAMSRLKTYWSTAAPA